MAPEVMERAPQHVGCETRGWGYETSEGDQSEHKKVDGEAVNTVLWTHGTLMIISCGLHYHAIKGSAAPRVHPTALKRNNVKS